MKVAIIIAFKDFKDEEYFTPRVFLEMGGAEIKKVDAKLADISVMPGLSTI